MTDFDPAIHRLYKVAVTATWENFIVAESPEAAQNMALDEDYIASETTRHAHAEIASQVPAACLRDLPWGPINYEGKELSNEGVLRVLANHQPDGNLKKAVIDTKMPLDVYTPIPELTDWATKRGIRL